jgi:hypothetical protein
MKEIFKEFWKELLNTTKNNVNRKDVMTESESYGLQILEELLKSPKSEMLLSPNGTYYIRWQSIFAIIRDCRAQIINGRYFYDIAVSTKRSDDIREKFTQSVENRRNQMEKEMMEKTTRSLSTILEEIKAENNLLTTNTTSDVKI